MSATDKARPWDVKCLDDPSWLREDHDHTNGPCDLPARPAKTTNPFGEPGSRCTWVATKAFWAARANGCGCPRCTDQVTRRAERRRSRHQASEAAAAEQRHLTTRAAQGIPVVDDLADLEAIWRTDDDVTLRGRIADALDLPGTSLVVDIANLGGPFDPELDCCYDCSGCNDRDYSEYVVIEIMHADGSRETRRFDTEWGDLEATIARGDQGRVLARP